MRREAFAGLGVSGEAAAPAPTSPARGRLLQVVGPLLALEIALWLVLLGGAGLFRAGPNGKSLATDFAVFSGAALAVQHGANPYDNRVLYRYERGLMQQQHLPVTTNVDNVRAGNPPLFYWAIEPLTSLPFQPVAMGWILGLAALSALALLVALHYFRWDARIVPVIVFLLMPQTALGAAYGNIHAVVLLVLALGLALGRRFPLCAGLVLSLGWLKPQLALPLAALVVLFHCPRPRRMVGGFGLGTAFGLGATLAALGPGLLGEWIQGMTSWSHSEGLEPNLSSLVGLYAGWLPYGWRLAVGVAILAAGLGLTGWTWLQARDGANMPFMRTAWLWVVWFLASPFAHFPDEMLLVIPVLAYIGSDGRNLTKRGPVAVLYLSFFSLALFPATVLSVNFLSVMVGAVGVMLFRASRDIGYAGVY